MCLRGGALPEATNCSSRLPLSSEPTLSPLTKAHRLFSNSGEYSGCTCGSWNRHQRHKDHFSTIIKWILEQAHIRTIIRSRATEKTRLQYCETRRETCILVVIFRLQIFFQSCYSLANTGHNSSNRMCFPGRTLEQLPTLSFLVFCQVSTAHVPSVSSVSLVTNDPPSVWSCPWPRRQQLAC